MCDTPDPETNQYTTYRTEEIRNKARQFRYFSRDAYHKLELGTNHSLPDRSVGSGGANKRQREQDTLVTQDIIPEEEGSMETGPPTKQVRIQVSEDQQQQEQNVLGEKRKRSPETGSTTKSPSPAPKKTTKKKAVNTTKLRRQQTILEIVEKNHICEMNNDLFIEFNSIEQAAGAPKTTRKTFRNLANELNSEGRLKIVTSDITMKFGMVEYKTFILHHSLDENSKEFIDVIEKYKVGWSVVSTPNVKEYRQVSVDKSPSKDPENQKDLYPVNWRQSIWRPTAIENGWISSKWLKIHAVHNYLFTRFLQIQDQTGGSNLVDSSDFVTLMPLDLLIKVFASISLDTELQEYSKSSAHRELCLNDLPEYIQTKLSVFIKRLKTLISSMLDALEALELIKQLRKDSKLLFEVKQQVHIYNYTTSPPSLLETMTLQSTEDIDLYWFKLKNHYVKVHPFMVDKPTSSSLFVKPHPLHNITAVRTWFTEERYSEEQKAILNSFIDYEAGSTPSSSNKPLMTHLTDQLRLPMDRIKAYYMSVDVAFARDRNKIKLMEEKKNKANQTSDVIQTLMAASIEKQKVETAFKRPNGKALHLEPTFIGSRRFRKLKVKSKRGDKAYLGKRKRIVDMIHVF